MLKKLCYNDIWLSRNYVVGNRTWLFSKIDSNKKIKCVILTILKQQFRSQLLKPLEKNQIDMVVGGISEVLIKVAEGKW